MSSSQSSNNIASVAFAAFNRFFHHTTSETKAKMTSQSSQGSPATAPNPSASPISPTYSDAGSGFSAPSPSPFSSSSASTSATSYNGSGVPDFSDYHHSGSLYDYSTSPSGPSEVDASLAHLYNPTTGEVLAGQPGGVSSEYSAFSVHHSSGDPVYTPAGELDLSYNSVLEAGYLSPTQNECSSYITWSPRNQAQSLADSRSNNSYQRLVSGSWSFCTYRLLTIWLTFFLNPTLPIITTPPYLHLTPTSNPPVRLSVFTCATLSSSYLLIPSLHHPDDDDAFELDFWAYQQQQGQHITDATSTSTTNHSNGGGSGDGASSTAIPPSTSSPQSSAVNFNVSNAPAKPGILGPLYIPQPQPSSMPLSASSTGGSVPIHSPIPSRYPDPPAVSGGQPAQYPQLMPPLSEYPHNLHQRHSSSGSTGSNGGHPVLFDVDLDEWHPHPVAQSHSQPHPQSQHGRYPSSGSASVSPPQMYQQTALQQSQQSYGHPQIPRPHPTSSPPRPASHFHAQSLHLNVSVNPHPAGSPASPLSSLSPGQMPLPLTPGHEVGHGHGADYGNGLGLTSGPPRTPMSSLNVVLPVVGPSSYPGMTSPGGAAGNSQVFLNQKRASLGLVQPSVSLNPGSLSPTSRHHPHPYAQGYQQRSAHGRPSPLHHHHQMQQARRSPLHQEYFDDANPGARKVNSMNSAGIPEDDDYAGQYEKMYRESQKQDMRRNERSRDKAQLPGTSGVKQTLDQRRHSAPLLDMQHFSRSRLGEHRMQPSPIPILLGEIGRRPSAPAVHQVHHLAQQQQKYGSPNNGGYAPASTSPSSVSSSRSVPHPPSLSASSSNSSIASRSPVAHLASQSLPAQHSQQQSGLAAVATQHDRTRFLSDIMNSSSMTCIPGSMFDEDGINVISGGVDVPSMMQLEIEEKISQHQQQHHHQQAPFDMDIAMELMDVDAHPGAGVDLDLGMDPVMRMNMEFSGLHHHHPSSSDPTATGTNVYISPISVTIDMSDLTDGHVNSNQAISPSMMMLEDHGNPNNIKTNDFEQQQDVFDFDSVLDAAPSPTLVGGATGAGMVQDWQKAGGEYDSADSSDSDSEGEGGLSLLSGVEAGSGDGLEGGRGGEGGVEAGAVKSSGKQHRAKAGSTALGGDILTTGSATVKRAGTVGRSTMKQRASTRTITSRSTRTKSSTQTLTPQDVKPDTNGSEVDSGLGEDEDADGEEDLEEDPGEVEAAEEDEDDFSSSDESFDDDDDDDKDGEFVPRSRSKGATVSRSNSRRALPGSAPSGLSASAPIASRARAGGRSLRTRGNHNGRYNPYSIYAATACAAQQPAEVGSSAPSISGLRTLNAPATGFESGASDRSPSPSISGDDGSADGKARKVKPAASLPVPVPVPNLTKKSRGRRVPTVSSLEELRKTSSQANGSSTSSGTTRKGRGGGGIKGTRMYLCDVEGCGKCFARGEHLKRHVRSIHTNEKPHTCPYPGCGKDFSRHDNLGQHMRVHKDYVPPPGSVKA